MILTCEAKLWMRQVAARETRSVSGALVLISIADFMGHHTAVVWWQSLNLQSVVFTIYYYLQSLNLYFTIFEFCI